MKIGKSRSSADSLEAGTGITAANYCDRARAFVAMRGGVGFVIRGVDGVKGSALSKMPSTDAQWVAWLCYFDDRKIPTKFMAFNGEYSVPCEWPEDFDAEARQSNRIATIYRRGRYPDDGERQRINAGFSRLKGEIAKAVLHMDVSNLRENPKSPPSWRTMTREDAANHLDELMEAKELPIKPLSSEALRPR